MAMGICVQIHLLLNAFQEKKHVSKIGRRNEKYRRGEKNVFGHCAELVGLQKQDHLIHSSIHDESIGPELGTQL